MPRVNQDDYTYNNTGNIRTALSYPAEQAAEQYWKDKKKDSLNPDDPYSTMYDTDYTATYPDGLKSNRYDSRPEPVIVEDARTGNSTPNDPLRTDAAVDSAPKYSLFRRTVPGTYQDATAPTTDNPNGSSAVPAMDARAAIGLGNILDTKGGSSVGRSIFGDSSSAHPYNASHERNYQSALKNAQKYESDAQKAISDANALPDSDVKGRGALNKSAGDARANAQEWRDTAQRLRDEEAISQNPSTVKQNGLSIFLGRAAAARPAMNTGAPPPAPGIPGPSAAPPALNPAPPTTLPATATASGPKSEMLAGGKYNSAQNPDGTWTVTNAANGKSTTLSDADYQSRKALLQ